MSSSKLITVVLLVLIAAAGLGSLLFISLKTVKVEIQVETEGGRGGTTVMVGEDELGKTNDQGSLSVARRLKKGEEYKILFSNLALVVLPAETTIVAARGKTFLQIRSIDRFLSLEIETVPITGDARVLVDHTEVGTTGTDGSWQGKVEKVPGDDIALQVQSTTGASWDTSFTVSSPPGPLRAMIPVSGVALIITTVNQVGNTQVLIDGSPAGVTNDSGQIRITADRSEGENLQISFVHPGATASEWAVTVPQRQLGRIATLRHEIRLVLTAPLALKFFAFADDKPASGIQLTVNGEVVGSTDTAGTLAFPLTGVLVGERLHLAAQGGESLAASSFDPQTVVVRPGVPEIGVTAKFEIAKYVELIVIGEKGPLEGVRVMRDSVTLGTTDEKGVLEDRVAHLEEQYVYTLRKEGFVPLIEQVTPMQVRTKYTARMASFWFRVKATNSLDGTPLSGVALYSGGPLPLATTDVDGTAEVRDWREPGTYTFYAQKLDSDRFKRTEFETAVSKAGHEMAISLEPFPAQLVLTFKLEGSGEPLRNARVVMTKGVSADAQTDTNGQVTIKSHSLQIGKQYAGEVRYRGFVCPFNVLQDVELSAHTVTVPLMVDVTLVANEPGAELRIMDAKTGKLIQSGLTLITAQLQAGQYRVWGKPGYADSATYDRLRFFNQATVWDTILVVSYFTKGKQAERDGQVQEALDNYGRVEEDDPAYGRAQILRAQIYLARRDESFVREEGADFDGIGALDAFDRAWAKSGEWRSNPNLIFRAMTLSYELKQYSAAQNWFDLLDRKHRSGNYDPDPRKHAQKFVRAYFYGAKIKHNQYAATHNPPEYGIEQGRDQNRLRELRDTWNQFEQIAASRGAGGQDYKSDIQAARDQLAVW